MAKIPTLDSRVRQFTEACHPSLLEHLGIDSEPTLLTTDEIARAINVFEGQFPDYSRIAGIMQLVYVDGMSFREIQTEQGMPCYERVRQLASDGFKVLTDMRVMKDPSDLSQWNSVPIRNVFTEFSSRGNVIYKRLRDGNKAVGINDGIDTVDQLLDRTEADLLTIKGIARPSVDYIIQMLAAQGLELKPDELLEAVDAGEYSNMSLEDFWPKGYEFSMAAHNSLKKARVDTIGLLVQNTAEDLLKIRNFGERQLLDVLETLAQVNLRIKGQPTPKPTPYETPKGAIDFNYDAGVYATTTDLGKRLEATVRLAKFVHRVIHSYNPEDLRSCISEGAATDFVYKTIQSNLPEDLADTEYEGSLKQKIDNDLLKEIQGAYERHLGLAMRKCVPCSIYAHDVPIQYFEFDLRTFNTLMHAGIDNAGILLVNTAETLMCLDGFGSKCLSDVVEKLDVKGIELETLYSNK